MIKKRINSLKKKLDKLNIDGYIIPKNDEYFSEYVSHNRLKFISNFSGSAGFAVILKKTNYLFVDGRYTIQAKNQSGKIFNIIEIHKSLPYKIFKNIKLGFDPKLFTSAQLNLYFRNKVKLLAIEENLIKYPLKKKNKISYFYSLPEKVVGKSHLKKIHLISKLLHKNKSDFLFISAPENAAWLLNIRGSDIPFSPIPNCNLIISKNRQIFLISNKKKLSKLVRQGKISKKQIVEPKMFRQLISNLNGKNIIIDSKTCSVFKEKIIRSKFNIIKNLDPCYFLKSIKSSKEIIHMKKSHIEDGVALTKFLYWIKNPNRKKITEIEAEKKLEQFRKGNKNYLYPSFNTIAGSGPNGAIIHYRANKDTNRIIKKKDLFLCDSGGQYKYGTTDVTRTICFSKQPTKIKNIFTKVLKGHISVANCDLNKNKFGAMIDILARKYLKKSGLDYAHGTGHGVGFFSNVHEGPQSISKFNRIKLKEGMVLSNEPGYYKEGKFGIRIENLIFIKKVKKKLMFENLTMAPIDKDLINQNLLTPSEKKYLFKYDLEIYKNLSKFLNKNERTWLLQSI